MRNTFKQHTALNSIKISFFIKMSFLFLFFAGSTLHSKAVSFTSSQFGSLGDLDNTQINSLQKKIRFKKIKQKTQIFNLTTSPDLPFRDFVEDYLRPYALPDYIEIKVLSEKTHEKTRRESIKYAFYVRGLKIDSFMLKANKHSDGSIFISGSIPDFDDIQHNFDGLELPDVDSIKADFLVPYFATASFSSDDKLVKILNHFNCATIRDYVLMKAKCIEINHIGNSYKVTVDELGINNLVRKSFNLTATLKSVYLENWKGDKGNHNVVIFDNPGNELTNSRFVVRPYDGDGSQIKANSSKEFAYSDVNSSAARQIHAFSFANRMFDWYESLGVDLSQENIKIFSGGYVEIPGQPKNYDQAAYYPTEKAILIGKGSGQGFKNMGLDIDVVAHEVGHFIVFKGINEISLDNDEANQDHTPAIHEGLADFFTFAATGDSCLAESICVAGSGFCVTDQCLRVGEDIGFTFGSLFYNQQPSFHGKGQLVSAILWSARKKQDKADFFAYDQVILNALDYVPNGNVSYGDLMVGIMASDKELQNGKFCNDILNSAKEFEIEELIDGDCAEFNAPNKKGSIVNTDNADEGDYSSGITSITAIEQSGGSNISTEKISAGSSRRSQSKGGCAVIGVHQRLDLSSNKLLIFLLIFLPSFVPICRIRKS